MDSTVQPAPDVELANTGTSNQANLAQPGQGKSLRFVDVQYRVRATVDKVQENKVILHGVSGHVPAGSMLCILGPSGCGKTSLINIISGRLQSTGSQSHTVSGQVLVDGQVLSPTVFRRISGLVTQEDVFNSSLTVEETLQFAAGLKLKDMRSPRVKEIINALQLNGCAGTFVGDDSNPYLKGISGGEKRRVAIALELIDPSISILMLDEPTSGLDAAAAQNVTNLLSELAVQHRMAVITTLHQPRTSIMQRFDSVMVLCGGRTLYAGVREGFLPYLTTTLKATVPTHESPYDFVLDSLNPAIVKQTQTCIGVVPDGFDGDMGTLLSDHFDRSGILASELAKPQSESLASSLGGPTSSTSLFQAVLAWLQTCRIIFYRTFLIKMRDPICLMTQVSSAIIMGLIFGMLYFNTYSKSSTSFVILDTQMCISMSTLMAVWLPYDVTLTFPIERRIFLRERKAGLYSTSAFYTARVAADMPAHIVSAIIMAVIVKYMAGLEIDIFAFSGIMVAGILVGAAIMQLIGAISRTFEEANIYMMVILMMSMMLGSGFVRDVPGWLSWARGVSIMGIISDMSVYLEFKDVKEKYGTPSEIYDEYGVLITNDSEMRSATGVLIYIYVICRVLCFLSVKFLFTGRSFQEDLKD